MWVYAASIFLTSMVSIIAGTFIPLIWSIIFIPLIPFGIHLHKVSGIEMKKFLKSKVKNSTIREDDDAQGWIYGRWFVGYLHIRHNNYSSDQELYLLCNVAFYNKNIKNKQNQDGDKAGHHQIKRYYREGSFFNIGYSSRHVDYKHVKMNSQQKTAINNIISMFNIVQKTVCLLCGPAGSGKSTTSILLAKEMLKTCKDVSYCTTFTPTDPGDGFERMYTEINPTKDNPLIVVLEEVDIMIAEIHNLAKQRTKHNKIPTQITSKISWNAFLDDFDHGLFPHTIIIMTTNKTPEFFDELDTSYMRKGRVDLRITYDQITFE